jgi:succinate dehydrogenase / fumarate reductase membrane anchor subunit
MSGVARRRPSIPWLLIRLTALILAVLVLAHFAVTHLMTDVAMTDSAFVAARWQSGVVAATDWLMLVTAVLHGGAGAWMIAEDSLAPGTRRMATQSAIAVLGAAMIVGGTVTLLLALG